VAEIVCNVYNFHLTWPTSLRYLVKCGCSKFLPNTGFITIIDCSDLVSKWRRHVDTATCVTRRTSNIDRRLMLRSYRSTAMELAANQSKTVSQSGTIQKFVKDIPV